MHASDFEEASGLIPFAHLPLIDPLARPWVSSGEASHLNNRHLSCARRASCATTLIGVIRVRT